MPCAGAANAGRRDDDRLSPGSPAAESRLAVVSLLALTALLYGRHLTDGLLSDDYLYASWAGESLGSLLRRLTVDSYPRMLRPLLAPFWLLAGLPGGEFLLHLLSLLLHAGSAILIFRILRVRTGATDLALLFALAFVAFPLSAEAVVWLSGSFDLWATTLALLPISLATEANRSPTVPIADDGRSRGASTASVGGHLRTAAGAGLFLLALLAKESVFLLPAVLPFLLPRRGVLRAATTTGLVAALYLLVRLALFGGLGGYVTSEGRTTLETFAPQNFLRALALQLPARMLSPVKAPTTYLAAIAACSALLLAAGALAGRRQWSLRALVLALAAFVLALLPAAGVFRVEWDLEGSRLLYFPVAVGLLALGTRLRTLPRLAAPILGLLVAGWALCAFVNARSWHAAHLAAQRTLDAMATLAPGFPPGATVLVDALDTEQGAYVFRNGLPQAALRRGLRSDLTWQRGTAAEIGLPMAASRMRARTLFEIGPTSSGGAVDWTPCEQALLQEADSTVIAATHLATVLLSPAAQKQAKQWVSQPVVAPAHPNGIAVWLRLRPCPQQSILKGTLFWRRDLRQPFTTTTERNFTILATPSVLPLRLPNSALRGGHLQLRVDVDGAAIPAACWEPIVLAPLPAACPTAD